jgi:putative tryptophan/tyrosine transport system substrate-binding protein
MRFSTIGLVATLALALLVATLAAQTRQPAKVYRLGFLREGTRTSSMWALYLEELHRLGYIEGHNLIIEPRYAETREQLPALAAELVARQVDLILTGGTLATQAVQQATATIPIVFTLGDDPAQSGLVASDARPGGNVTGFVGGVYEAKQLELLKDAIPGIGRVACPCRSQRASQLVDATRGLGLVLQDLDVLGLQDLDMQKLEDVERFFAVVQRTDADAVLVPNRASFRRYLPRLGELAAQSRLPTIGYDRQFVESGGLLSYGPKQGEGAPRVAAMVDKILKGTKPADIPVERHMRVEFVINLKAAEALGLTLPPHILVLADEVLR